MSVKRASPASLRVAVAEARPVTFLFKSADFCNLSRRFPESLREHIMKLLALLAATTLLSSPLLPAAEPSPLAWSFRLSLEDQKTPLQQQLLKKFQPVLGAFGNLEFLKQLAWVKVVGLTEAQHPDETAFILHLHFRDNSTAKALLGRLGDKDHGDWEELNGLRALKFSASLQGKGSDVAYLAIPDDHHLVLCSSRPAFEILAATSRETYLADAKDGELLGAEFYIPALKEAAAGTSELLAMLDGHLALKVVPGGEFVDLQSTAEMTNKRSANRARRILEGLVAAMAAQLPPDAAAPLDERLEITADGKNLNARMKLTNAEVQRWLDAIETDLKGEFHFDAKKPSAK